VKYEDEVFGLHKCFDKGPCLILSFAFVLFRQRFSI